MSLNVVALTMWEGEKGTRKAVQLALCVKDSAASLARALVCNGPWNTWAALEAAGFSLGLLFCHVLSFSAVQVFYLLLWHAIHMHTSLGEGEEGRISVPVTPRKASLLVTCILTHRPDT